MSIVDDFMEATRNDAKLRVTDSIHRCMALFHQLNLADWRRSVADCRVGDLLEIATNLACEAETAAQAACAVRLAQRTSDQLERLVRWSRGNTHDFIQFSSFDTWARREISKFKD